MKKIGIIGSGMVAKALAKGFIENKYEVMIGSRDAAVRQALEKETGITAGTFEEVAAFGQIIVLAVKGSAAEQCVKGLAGFLDGKIVIDPTNPIADAPPVNGVIHFFTSLDESLMERLQRVVPGAHFVKAFSSVGAASMYLPAFELKPSMFICGNNQEARKEVSMILEQFGWETEDMGMAEAARAIEPICILWCIRGMLQNKWDHAFKLMKH